MKEISRGISLWQPDTAKSRRASSLRPENEENKAFRTFSVQIRDSALCPIFRLLKLLNTREKMDK